jgi:hypothetical protein
MEEKSKYLAVKIMVVLTYLVMIVVNALASILPINGMDTGQVSDSFPNLFAPAGLTFSIWGLIYLLLAAYTLYQLGLFQADRGAAKTELFAKIGVLFAISSLANAAWILAWHYLIIALSLLLMLVILALLAKINLIIISEELNSRERFFIRLPFNIYFGWITVATIANVTSLLVFSGWDQFGLSAVTWMLVIVPVGAIIGLLAMFRFKSVAYGLVIIWAYLGIVIKHTSASGFAGQYPSVIMITIISLVALVAGELYLIFAGRNKKVLQQ